MKRIFVMLLACLMLLSVVPFSVFAEEADHEHGATEQCPGKEVDHTLENTTSYTKINDKEGLCGSYSYTVYQCNVCGELFADNFVKTENDSHDWDETTKKVEATCTEPGKEAIYTCSNCGATKGGETIPPAHNYVDGTCTGCGAVLDPACEHKDLIAESATLITAPTCGVAGLMQYTCECGAYVEVEIEALGHDEANLVPSTKVDATCTETGVKAHGTCADCGKFFIDGKEVTAEDLVIEALGHDMNEAIIVKPTCTESGSKTVTCKRCDYKEETPLKPEHTWSQTAAVTDPTCTRPGMAYDFCVICGHYENVEVAPALGHKAPEGWTHGFTEEEIANAPCDKELSTSYNCATCGVEVKVIVKAATAHTFDEDIEKATCSTVEKIWNVCACGAKVLKSEGTEFNPDVHNWEWKWINEATCEKDGNKILFCYGCNTESGNPVFVPAGHTWVPVKTVNPSCGVLGAGRTDYKCDVCGDTRSETIPPVKCTFDNGTYHAATCSHDAYTTYTCTVCGYSYNDVHEGTQLEFDWTKKFETLKDAQEAHENSVFVEFEVISGSCTEKGLIIYTCTLCNKNVLVVKAGTGEGHKRPEGKFNCEDAFKCEVCGELVKGGAHEDVIDVEPTCDKAGKAHCAICGAYYYVYKHGFFHKAPVVVPPVKPTCTETGLTEGLNCGDCGEVIIAQDVVPATGHNNWTKVDAFSVVRDCEVDGYDFMVCECGALKITGYEFATGHWYIDAEGNKNVLVPDCNAECVCGEEICVCRVCSLCGETIERHQYADPNVVPPTCTEEGYTITVCTACGDYIIEEESIVEPIGHNFVPAEGSIPATYKPGYIKGECSVCGEKIEETVKAAFDMGLTIEIDNAVAAGYGFSDSSLVAVKINLNSIKEVGVWSINFNLNYNSDKFTYVNTEFVGETFDGYAKAVDNGTFVAIGATTANDENKQLVDAILNAENEAFAIVYFTVNDQIADGVTEADVIVNPFAIDATFALNKANEEVTVWGQTETEIAIEKFLDYNKDGVVNAIDYKYAWEIISGTIDVVYDVTLDVDKDGQILENDFVAIFSYILGDAEYAYEVLVDRVVEAA